MCHARTLVLISVYCLVFVDLSCSEEITELLQFDNVTRIRRQACNGFRCNNGDCIADDQECDGLSNCRDGSDETNHCQNINCPRYLFRCKYGACISPDKQCDGRQDCRDNSDETTAKCTKNFKICSPDEFKCTSGQCIAEDFKCDGTPQCDDNSDETQEACLDMRCPGYTFKCAYGACVNLRARCNGANDCVDGSDEDPQICGGTVAPPQPKPPVVNPVTSTGACILPQYPDNGYWIVRGSTKGAYNPGEQIGSNSIVSVFCNKGFKIDGQVTIICENGKWNVPLAVCKSVCPSFTITKHMMVTCSYANNILPNCVDPPSGTIARFKCDDFYEISTTSRNEVLYCSDGSWDKSKPHCKPVCGKKSVTAETLIINGTVVTKGENPWQVALYYVKNYVLFCGGSLLNEKIILTAAHCVTHVVNSTIKVRNKEDLEVVAGKYYRNYTNPKDVNAQFSKIEDLVVSPYYKGDVQNYRADIAIIVAAKTFVLNKFVLPICLDWGKNYDSLFLNPSSPGLVTGWGLTKETSDPSEVLKELVVPFIDQQTCERKLPFAYRYYLTDDKVCAGLLNEGSSVCKGDSGGGLALSNTLDGRYYVVGIVSIAPQGKKGGCDSQQIGLYTKVADYIENFILKETIKHPV